MKFSSSTASLFVATAALLEAAPSENSQSLLGELLTQKLLAGQQELPSSAGEDWKSLENGMEFLPAENLTPLAKEHLRRLTGNAYGSGVYEQATVDGSNTYYDEYAQAWRALGFYIDCDYQGNNNRRQLEQEGDGANNGNDGAPTCTRMLLWAAYVDEGYEGNGVGEYMYYDRKNDVWDNRACKAAGENHRCVKMDCHLSNTKFSLLGFFKEPNYNDWMEQLFKHEGDCVWTDEEFGFMQGSREVWPQGCTDSGLTAMEGEESVTIYYDIAPSRYGEFEIGLYTEASCVVQYSGSLSATEAMRRLVCGDVDGGRRLEDGDPCLAGKSNYNDAIQVLKRQGYYNDEDGDGNHDNRGDIWELASNLEEWNAGFDVWKQCQPCKTYDLTNIVAGTDYYSNSDGLRYNWTSAAMNGGEADGDDPFECNDAAGYDNVNQCMKFRTKTDMLTATWNDIEVAMNQGTIARLPFKTSGSGRSAFKFSGYALDEEQEEMTRLAFAWIFLMVSAILFGSALYRCKSIQEEAEDEGINAPLICSEEAVLGVVA